MKTPVIPPTWLWALKWDPPGWALWQEARTPGQAPGPGCGLFLPHLTSWQFLAAPSLSSALLGLLLSPHLLQTPVLGPQTLARNGSGKCAHPRAGWERKDSHRPLRALTLEAKLAGKGRDPTGLSYKACGDQVDLRWGCTAQVIPGLG